MWGNSQQTLQATTTETNTVNQAERRGSKITLWCTVGTDRITVTVFFKNTTTSEMGALSRISCVDISDRLPQYPYKHDMATVNAASVSTL